MFILIALFTDAIIRFVVERFNPCLPKVSNKLTDYRPYQKNPLGVYPNHLCLEQLGRSLYTLALA